MKYIKRDNKTFLKYSQAFIQAKIIKNANSLKEIKYFSIIYYISFLYT